MAFCANCGAELAAGANNCVKCGKAVGQSVGGGAAAAPAPAPTAGGLQDNVAGMLAYITIIPAIIFLVMEPYNRSKLVRFHAFQCLFLFVALVAVDIVLGFIPSSVGRSPRWSGWWGSPWRSSAWSRRTAIRCGKFR